MFRKWIFATILLFGVAAQSAFGGWSAWGLAEQDIDSRNNGVEARVGYRAGQLEAFLGSSWWPRYDSDADLDPPQVLSVGALYHARDLLDRDNPLPWIPDILLALLPEDMKARPYSGGQVTFDFSGKDQGYSAAQVGLSAFLADDSRNCFVVEGAWRNNYGQLSGFGNDFVVKLGFCFRTK